MNEIEEFHRSLEEAEQYLGIRLQSRDPEVRQQAAANLARLDNLKRNLGRLRRSDIPALIDELNNLTYDDDILDDTFGRDLDGFERDMASAAPDSYIEGDEDPYAPNRLQSIPMPKSVGEPSALYIPEGRDSHADLIDSIVRRRREPEPDYPDYLSDDYKPSPMVVRNCAGERLGRAEGMGGRNYDVYF